MTEDLYDTLGVPPSASEADIKRAYRRAAKSAHSDRKGGDKERMALINVAYETLSNSEKRRRYDKGEDPSRPKTLDQEAIEMLCQMFSQALGKWAENENQQQDPLTVIRLSLDQGDAQMKKTISNAPKVRKRLNKALKKHLKVKNPNSFYLEAVLRKSIKTHEAHIKMLKHRLKIGERMRKILDDYEWDSDLMIQIADEIDLERIVRAFFSKYGAT